MVLNNPYNNNVQVKEAVWMIIIKEKVFANPIRNVRKPWIFEYSKSPIIMARQANNYIKSLEINDRARWLNIAGDDRCP